MKSVIIALAAAATLALAATPAVAGTDPTFADCPALPAGAVAGQWRCEVLTSQATLSFGHVRDLHLNTMRMTFAEGRLDGGYAQEFGALRSAPTRLPGVPATTLRFRYGGYSDFHSTGERKGAIELVAELNGPLVPRNCRIGPIHSVLLADGPTEVISTEPEILRFSTIDDELAFPRATGCGPLANLLLGLPAPADTNSYHQTSQVRLLPY
jgi:hypothetical protein